ncbi:MAG TPA: hypothetical protein VFZ21_25170 [Gemmatimonadaceae bacterium]|jgi:hypothetical protein|nr:hypothetical protein [Gemmatimonadaceae bacterium]
MTTTDPAPAPANPEPVPLPLRVAAILSAIVGVVTTVAAAGGGLTGPEAARYNGVTMTFGVVAGVSLCVGAALVFRRRRLGAGIVVMACVLPTVIGVFTTGRVHPPALLLILATITVLANWRLLR